ncbi:MAG: Hsp20/alpha crystallin family protein [Planctomycetes bacterium]|nr:Hsp20/alpha crystallin family protein [Planctomycetota bacterium]
MDKETALQLVPWRKRDLTPYRSEFDEFFERFLDPQWERSLPSAMRGASLPPVDVAETEKAWSFSFELPGLRESDIQVQLLGHQLVVSGERKWEEEKKEKEFHRVESRYGAFQRSLELPENARLEADELVASYKKGILEITVPKTEPTLAVKIPVQAG